MFKYLRMGSLVCPVIIRAWHWMRTMSNNPKKYDRKLRQEKVHDLIVKVSEILRIEYFIDGYENIPDESVIFIPNHQSNMDALTFLAILERQISFLSKKEAADFPFVGRVIKVLDGTFMDRSNVREEIRAIREVAQYLEENPTISYAIFPEGTRSKDENKTMNVFKPGALKAAYYSKRTIVPVALFGTFRALDNVSHLKHYPVQVKFLPAITYEEYKDMTTIDLSDKLHHMISEKVEVERLEDIKLIKSLNCKRKKVK